MSQTVQEFTDLLLQRGEISREQLAEAESLADVGELLVMLEYATPEVVTATKAECLEVPVVDLREQEVSEQAITLVPESVAREGDVMPIQAVAGTLRIAIVDPNDQATINKLSIITNHEIEVAMAPKYAIQLAINRYYGGPESQGLTFHSSDISHSNWQDQ